MDKVIGMSVYDHLWTQNPDWGDLYERLMHLTDQGVGEAEEKTDEAGKPAVLTAALHRQSEPAEKQCVKCVE